MHWRDLLLVMGTVLTAVASFLEPAIGQSCQDQYTVNRSGENSTSPMQAAPGSDLWNLQRRLSALNNLAQEMAQYQAAQRLMAYNDAIDDPNLNPWLKWQGILDFIGIFVGIFVPQPDDPLQEVHPPWQDSQAENAHLSSLEHAIGYDARQLGLEGDQITAAVVLNRFSSFDALKVRVSDEIRAVNIAIANSAQRALLGSCVRGAQPVKPAPSPGDRGAKIQKCGSDFMSCSTQCAAQHKNDAL